MIGVTSSRIACVDCARIVVADYAFGNATGRAVVDMALLAQVFADNVSAEILALAVFDDCGCIRFLLLAETSVWHVAVACATRKRTTRGL